MSGARPFVAGLFEGEGPSVRLLGTRCTSCGTLYFPQAPSCRNPDCDAKAVRPEALPDTGRLHSFTLQRYRPPALFRMDDWAPYVLGVADLGEGVQVMGMVTGAPFKALAIDMPVRLTTGALHRDDDGAEVLTFMLEPVRAGGVGA